MGIVLVSVASAAAFLHVMCILDGGVTGSTTASLVRTLFLSDGKGIEEILRLGADAREIISGYGSQATDADVFNQLFLLVMSFTFCVCVLNLFIAVHGKAYHDAILEWPILYEKERAHMCEMAILLPYWR